MQRCILIAVVVLAASAARAADTPIDIKTDLEGAKFFIVEKGGTATNPTVLVKRADAAAKIYYVKREFDCRAHTVKTVGQGESLTEVNKPLKDATMRPIASGSIADQLARHVCPPQH